MSANDWTPDPVLAGRVLELKVNSSWVKAPEWTFRSWTGERRVDGVTYTGPAYYLGSNTVSIPGISK